MTAGILAQAAGPNTMSLVWTILLFAGLALVVLTSFVWMTLDSIKRKFMPGLFYAGIQLACVIANRIAGSDSVAFSIMLLAFMLASPIGYLIHRRISLGQLRPAK